MGNSQGSSRLSESEESESMKTSAPEDVVEGQPLRKRNVQWFDASDEIPMPFQSASEIPKNFVISKEEAEAFWKSPGEKTPTKPCSQVFQSKRSPTSRFLHSRKIVESPMRRCHKPTQRGTGSKKLQVRWADEAEEEEEEEASEVEKEEDETDGCCQSRTPTPPKMTAAPLTDSAEKRKKKREKKKARQARQENLIKKQKAQRAEEEKIYEQKMLTHKRALARYAAAVAKPTIREGAGRTKATTKTCAQPPPLLSASRVEPVAARASAPQKEVPQPQPESPIPSPAPFVSEGGVFDLTSTGTSSIPVSPQFSEASIYFTPPTAPHPSKDTFGSSSDSSGFSSSAHTTPETPPSRTLRPARNREPTPPRPVAPRIRRDTPLTSRLSPSQILGKHLPLKLEEVEVVEEKEKKKPPVSQDARKMTAEKDDEEKEFKVTMNGEVRTVKTFTPSKDLAPVEERAPSPPRASSSQESYSDRMPIYPEPCVVPPSMMPTQENPLPPTSQPYGTYTHPPPPVFIPSHQPPPVGGPRYVQMPLPFPPPQQHPPIVVQQPIISSYGPVPSRFPYAPPPRPFGSMVPMAPMQMLPPPMYYQGQPIQRMQMGAPPPRFVPQVQTLPQPVQRVLQRPLRAPLPIVAPPAPPAALEGKEVLQLRQETQSPELSEEAPEAPEEEEERFSTPEPATPPEENKEDIEDLIEKMVLEDKQKRQPESKQPETSAPEATSSSSNSDDQHITAGVSSVLEGTDADNIPTSSIVGLPMVQPEEAANRVCIFAQNKPKEFQIWSGLVTEMPPRPEAVWMHPKYQQMWEEDLTMNETQKEPKGLTLKLEESTEKTTTKRTTLVTICTDLKPYFMNTRSFWMNQPNRVDGNHLGKIFENAYAGRIPLDHWKILEKVCQFQPGYIHVFHALIGKFLEFTYCYERNPSGVKNAHRVDPLEELYRSLPAGDGVERFFTRFREVFLPVVLLYISDRLITVRAFIAILEVIEQDRLTVSDLYYLANLVYGARPFFKRFASRFAELQIAETAGKRWIRKVEEVTEPRCQPVGDSRVMRCNRASGIKDFVVTLHEHIEDVLQLLPNTVINDREFLNAIKLVCGWRGDHEERIWANLTKDRAEFQKFYNSFEKYIRIEIRRETMYLRKQPAYDADFNNDLELNVVVPTTIPLRSALKDISDDNRTRKRVSYANQPIIASYEPLPSEMPTSPFEKFTQTGNLEYEKVWDVEKELIRHLKANNVTFEQFIQTTDAQEMYQFLVEFFQKSEHNYIAHVLEKSITEIREKSWEEVVQMREAAEEAHRQLELAREQHQREFEEMQQRMETISRFETYEVQVESLGRIDELKDRIKELENERENLVKQEVAEEKLAMDRTVRELVGTHLEEKRRLQSEIARLTEVNRHILTVEDVDREVQHMNQEREEAAIRWREELQKARSVCEETSRHLRESQLEIEMLRRQNQELMAASAGLTRKNSNSNFMRNLVTPDPEPENFGSISPPIRDDVRSKLKIMEKMLAELNSEKLIDDAREILQQYYDSGSTNCKERKNAKKQLREFEQALEAIQKTLEENIQMLKRGVSDDLMEIPTVPQPFSEKILQKVYEAQQGGSGHQNQRRESGDGDIPARIQNAETPPDESDEECLICHDVMPDEWDTISCETCTKAYHYECITKWLSINAVCPACFRALQDPFEFPSLG